MAIADLVTELKKLQFEEIRTNSGNFFEFVIRADRLNDLHPVLERHFGPALKSAGEEPRREVNERVSAFGGVRKDQTLYYKEQEGVPRYAMLWPWANGILVTVKVVESYQKR